jgi:6-phosphogluconolactonase
LAVLLTFGVCGSLIADDKYRFYVGTYTGGESQGIYVAELDLASGQASTAELAATSDNPSFVAIHPTGSYLYAVNETSSFQGAKTGSLSAFAIDQDTGRLKLLNQVASGGTAPCHLVVDAMGRSVLTANYGGGNVSVTAIRDDGSLGKQTSFHQHEGSSVNPGRQTGPHAHSINLDAANRFAFAADLGLDKIVAYRFDNAALKLTPTGNDLRVKPGAGPRHFSFHPSGRFAYVINELANTIIAMSYDPNTGVLASMQSLSTLPAGFEGTSHTAEVVVHSTGKFVYGSNRGHDSIAVFSVDDQSGKLSLVAIELTGGKAPRNFAIDPSGRFLLAENQASNTIVIFRIDPQTGALQATGQTLHVPSPVCVRFATIGG